MMQRIRQFIKAIHASINDADDRFLKAWLSEPEQSLFFQMSLPEQRHALDVAYTVQQLERKTAVNKNILIRCALLHDVGKVRGDISTMAKVFAVLVDGFCPERARRWARAAKSGRGHDLRHALYVYFHHAELGREKLLALGLTELAEIVAKHHEAPAEDDPPELLLLRQADELN